MVTEVENNVIEENATCETNPEKEAFLDRVADSNHVPDNSLEFSVEAKADTKQETPDLSFVQKLKSDIIYKRKFLLTLAFIASFFTLGWVEGQFGPTFLDLQIIAGTTLEKGSAFFAVGTVGYLTGSLLMGLLFDRQTLERQLLMFISVFGYGAVIAVIPWCGSYATMVMIHVFKGIFGGFLDTCGNAGMVVTWGREGDSFFQALHFAFAAGGIVSPLVTSPFLTSNSSSSSLSSASTFYSINTGMQRINHTVSTSTENITSQTIIYTTIVNDPFINSTKNSSSDFSNTSQRLTSRIFIPYTITTFLCIVTSLPFLIFFFRSLQSKEQKEQSKSDEDDNNRNKQKRHSVQIIGLVNMFIYIAVYVAVENTYAGYLATFLVKHFRFSKAVASYVTSAYWSSFAAGRFLGIFLVRSCCPAKLICIFNLMLTASLFGTFVTSLLRATFGVWLFAVIGGFSMSIIFPTVFLYTEQTFMKVTGKIASLFLFSASVGFLINPLLVGYLMDTFSPMWFCYLLFGESVLLFGLYLSGHFIARKWKKYVRGSIRPDFELKID